MNFEPMQAQFLAGPEIVLIVAVTMFCVFVVPIAGIVAIVYFIANRPKAKPQPAPVTPIQPAPLVARTEVMPRKCPQCGAALQPDAPEGLCPACLLQRGFATEAPSAQSSFVPPPVDELARLFPQLEIQECLGRGGMGAVYKARQPRLDRLVALKILAPEKQTDPQFAERFEREARVLAKLNHPNIVSVYEFGEAQGRFYLIMEYVDGLTLRQVMQAGKISPAQALDLVPKICEALQYAHGQGIVHRDIKPENILLDKQGRLKIADFGIAKIAGVEAKGLSLTGARDVMGTPAYMAPEQVEKPSSVDHRADIYSLGVVFYEMLTGELPLGKFPPPSKKVQLDVRLDEVVLHALEKEPARRYQQASQVKTAVESIAGSPPPIAAVPVEAGNVTASSGMITAPAVALMVAGLWKISSAILGMLALTGVNEWMGNYLNMGNILGNWSSVAIVSLVLFKLVPGLLIMFGGYQMLQRRSYAWAMAAGIIAIVACSLIGLPVGIWALVVLARDDVKAAFGGGGSALTSPMAATGGQPPGFGRYFFAIAGSLVLILLALMVFAVVAVVVEVGRHMPSAATFGTISSTDSNSRPLLPAAAFRHENGEYWTNFTRTFPLKTDGRFSIDNINGQIEIHGWSSNMVMVNTTIHGKTPEGVQAMEIHIDADPDRVSVNTREPSEAHDFWSFWRLLQNGLRDKATVDYTVRVPEQARLKDVSSVNGNIAIDSVAGDITASTVNGETSIKDASRNLKLNTVNGTITAEMNSLGSGQSVTLDAVNGELDLAVPANADATFKVTTVNGEISSEFPSLQPKHEWPVGNNLNGSLGNGAGSVKVDAVNGTIKFLKSTPPIVVTSNTAPQGGNSTNTVAAGNPLALAGSQIASAIHDASGAIAAAPQWLALNDAGNYSESWKQASAIFQAGVTEPAWENSMNTYRKPLGALNSRQLISSQPTTELPGAPKGQYVVMQFATSFANQKSAVETVTFDLEKDGAWKCSGYYIK